MAHPTKSQVLDAYAALPEAYQPAWGMDESRSTARRVSDDRLSVVLEVVTTFGGKGPLRILDIGCAQGYFSLAIKHELDQRGRAAEIIGVDYLEDNVLFCRLLAEHQGIEARFIHDAFDANFFERHNLPDVDFVLALNVLHHIRELNGEDAATAVLESIRRCSSVLLCELAQPAEALDWIGNWHASDDALLAVFAFQRRLANFETHLTKVKRPLFVCSNRYAYVGARWFTFEQSSDRAHAGVPDRFAHQRRVFIGLNHVIKRYRVDGDYADFNRNELAAEVSTLATLCDEPGRYPKVLAQADDGDASWIVRGKLAGRLLSDMIDAREAPEKSLVVRALLVELAHLESRGYHHADIRAWNVLWDSTGLRLIDFGSMTLQPSPLHRVALAATIAEIARGKIDYGQSFYCTLHPLGLYPQAWRPLLRYLLGSPQRCFSYAEALASFDRASEDESSDDVSHQLESDSLVICVDVLESSSAEQMGGFRRLEQHNEDLEQRFTASQTMLQAAPIHSKALQDELSKVVASMESERDDMKARLADAAQYAQSLQEQIKREAENMAMEREAAQVALDHAALHGKALEAELEKVVRDIEYERAAIRSTSVNTRGSDAVDSAHLQNELNKVIADMERERGDVKARLADAAQYAQSLREQIKREADNMVTERRVAQAALDDAASHGKALEAELKKVVGDIEHERYSVVQAGSQEQIKREALQASMEQRLARVDARYRQLEQDYARLHRRFRLFGPLMPKDLRPSKDKE